MDAVARCRHSLWPCRPLQIFSDLCSDRTFLLSDGVAPLSALALTSASLCGKTWAAEDKRRKKAHKLTYGQDSLTRWRLRFGKPKPSSFIRSRIRGGRVLDLGCGGGSGDLLEFFETYGIEISTNLARKSDAHFRTRGGYAINAPCVDGLKRFATGFFDACVARSYLEHEARPLDVLREGYRVLKPGGFIVVKVPNYATINRMVMGRKWCGFRYPDHLNYFTPASLRHMAARAGFSTHFRWLERLPSDYNMWGILTKPII